MKKILGLASVVAIGALSSAANAVHVNLELSLLVDVSGSVEPDEYALQRDGYWNAFKNPSFYSAVVGNGNSIAVNYIEWSTTATQRIGQTVIASQADATAFANAIHALTVGTQGSTSPGTALNFATPIIMNNTITSDKQVIDVSGDGQENILTNAQVDAARNAAIAAGVDQINGLVILNDEPATLEAWYNAHIRAGAGSFVHTAGTFAAFSDAIAEKIRIEVSGNIPLPGAAGMGFVGMGLVALRRRRTA